METPSVLTPQQLPAPPGPRPFARMKQMGEAPHKTLASMYAEYGDVFRYRSFFTMYNINRPEYVRRVLSAPYTRFSKATIDYRVLSGVLGQGLVTSDGEFWKHQRRLIQPMFASTALNRFDGLMNTVTGEMLDAWAAHGEEPLWLEREMSRLTFRIVGETLFGADIERHADAIFDILQVVNQSSQDIRALLTLWLWLPVASNRRFKQHRTRLYQIVDGLIDARRAATTGTDELLGRLLAARDEETGEGMPHAQIRDEAITLLLAGHETSSNALVWTFYALSQNPEVEQRLVDDLERVLGGRPAEAQDLSKLPYLKQVVQESMRLYPPVWAVARRAEQDEEFGGYLVPKGSGIYICQYALHRNPEFWPEPERFDPERFSPERVKGRDNYAYVPFAAGPRACIGASMAMLEIQLVLAQVLQRVRITPVPGHPIDTEARVTLNPRHGMKVTVTPR